MTLTWCNYPLGRCGFLGGPLPEDRPGYWLIAASSTDTRIMHNRSAVARLSGPAVYKMQALSGAWSAD